MKEYRFHGCCRHFSDEINDYAFYLKSEVSGFEFYKTNNGFYLGHLYNGKPHGFGYYYWEKNEAVYAGEWINNYRTGVGLYYSAGYFYIGEYLNDQRHGHGCSRATSGVEVEADYSNGERVNVWNTSDEFVDENGYHYNRKNNFTGKKEQGCSWIVFLIVIIIIMKMCG